MILAVDYSGWLKPKEMQITSRSDGAHLGIRLASNSYSSFDAPGKGPWKVTIGDSTVVEGVENQDALVVYQGQEHAVLKRS